MDSRIEALRRAVALRRDEMARFCAELVAVPTENPPGRAYQTGLEVVSDHLVRLGKKCRIEAVPGNEGSPEHPRFWLSSEWGEGERAVYFHGHIDVVPAQHPSQFDARVTDDTIFGRGSTDMKGGLVSMIYAIQALEDAGLHPEGRIALRIVPDEETGGAWGSRALVDRGLLFGSDACAMLTAEPTGGIVWHASRGALTYRVRVRGRPSHVGLQFRGANAFEKSLGLLRSLSAIKEDVERRSTRYPLEPEEARRSILMMGGEVAGEQNFNVVPASFSFTIDRRLNPEEDFDAEKRRLLEAIDAARAEGTDLELECIQEARPAGTSSDHPAARALADSIEQVKGVRPKQELCPGILEIRFYAEKGVPAFAYGPGMLSVAHGPNEFVKRRDLEECAVSYALAALRLTDS
jgi:acetylornithine deacetylase/succinyl-diaminopimelate desuccinylase family protein